ncbi:di-heme oxidoredictase family protein [Leptolyngbya sp. KIOST-1]|uniref:di-heme oxidoredictase family protein n=1 Tax=Leptolyngbya sp. KIOST-1 TaxID=1229172 RepID=UPI00068A546E|nr:di-heme oxidoredictase family protein [Leptolyngbya sp. KIOST-1]
MPLRTLIVLISLGVLAGFLGFQLELTLPNRPPDLASTYTPLTQPAPKGLGSYDVLGHTVSRAEAAQLLQTEAGKQQLSPDNGAVEITEDLLDLGRETFYQQTFGNEVLFTDLVGILDGPLGLPKLTKAILALKGQPTDNLQVTLDETLELGDRTFPAGTVINTGLDVPKGSVFPLGLVTHIDHARPKVGITCALCHATVNADTGKIIEGATNTDVNLGMLLALAPNSAALFRQTDVNPTEMPAGDRTYLNDEGEVGHLPDIEQLETAVDGALLSWPPGNFVSNGDMNNNSAQVPSSYTHEAFPYAWSGVASIGWFHGLTTLNNAVFGLNADPTTTADAAPKVLGIGKETYLGTMFQNAASDRLRLPEGARPSEFFDAIDPTPGAPGLNATIKMPEYPNGTLFMQNGLMAATPGHLVAAQLNGMSAWQNTLAPPPNDIVQDVASVQRGAKLFDDANCATCHSGRYFTNHRVIAQREVKTQPVRAPASKDFAEAFVEPDTYAPNVPVPLPADPAVLPVPTDITPKEDIQLAYAQSDPKGGYKVMKLIGAYLHAPYLHDGGVAASATALKPEPDGWFTVADPAQIGMVGTFMRGIRPDPAASLRMLVDRNLREPMVEVNRASPDLQRANVSGQGHDYWVDQQAGYQPQDQTDLVNFLLSLDDDPIALPPSVSPERAEANLALGPDNSKADAHNPAS